MPPKTLYKFMPLSGHLEATLRTPYLRFASAHKFNDPFETEGSYTYPPFSLNDTARYFSLAMQHELFVASGDVRRIKPFPSNIEPRSLYQLLVGHYSELTDNLMSEVYLNKIGVCCLVSDVLEGGLKSSCMPHLNRLMWSHYANGLSGVCLEFDALSLYQSLAELNPSNAISFAWIEYSEERPSINMFDFMELVYGNSNNLAMTLLETKNTKATVWSYEHEFRFKALNAVDANLRYSPKAIKAAYIGQRLTQENKACYKRILNDLGITNILEVALEPHSFKLQANPLLI